MVPIKIKSFDELRRRFLALIGKKPMHEVDGRAYNRGRQMGKTNMSEAVEEFEKEKTE